jgi:ABC-type hemin transport system substrate-binding protein
MPTFKLVNKITGEKIKKYHQESFASFYAFLINNKGYGKEKVLDQVKQYGIESFRIIDTETRKICFEGSKEPVEADKLFKENMIVSMDESEEIVGRIVKAGKPKKRIYKKKKNVTGNR